MSRELAEYLNAYSAGPISGFGLTVGPLPSSIRPIAPPGAPPALTPQATQQITDRLAAAIAPVLATAAAAVTSAAALDSQMWSLDAQWRLNAQWGDMRSCVRIVNVDGTVGTSSWVDGTCKNLVGNDVAATCNWGLWRLGKCDIATATTLSFQFPRYLWAQSRMRDMLANTPRPGVTSAQDTADWCWNAAQLVSVLLWSTNVRFDTESGQFASDMAAAIDPTAVRLDGKNIRPSLPGGTGLLPTDISRLDQTGLGESRMQGGGIQAAAPPDYDGAALVPGRAIVAVRWPLNVRVWNYVGNVGVTAHGAYPATRAYFDPAFAPVWTTNLVDDGGSHLDLPFTFSDVQAVQAQQRAVAPDISLQRRIAFNKFILYTWGDGRLWRAYGAPVYLGFDTALGTPLQVVYGTAQTVVNDYVRLLQFYSDPSRDYITWIHNAIQMWNLRTPVQLTSPAAADFVNAKTALMQSAAQAKAQYDTAAHSTTGATVSSIVFTAVSSILSMIGGIGAVLAYALQILQQLEGFLANAMSTTIPPCAAFPFIRVLAPASGGCDLSQDAIESALLGIDSNATWPVSVAGLTRAFVVDAVPFTVTFQAGDSTPDAVARRINAAAALVGLGAVASVVNGQVHVQGSDPTKPPVTATGGTAAALRFPGPTTAPPTGGQPPTGGPPATSSAPKSSSAPWLVGAALLAWRFLR